MLANWVSSPG